MPLAINWWPPPFFFSFFLCSDPSCPLLAYPHGLTWLANMLHTAPILQNLRRLVDHVVHAGKISLTSTATLPIHERDRLDRLFRMLLQW